MSYEEDKRIDQLDEAQEVSDVTKFVIANNGKAEYVERQNLGLLKTSDAFPGSYDDLTDVPLTFPPQEHTHPISDITGLQDALDLKANDADLNDHINDTDNPHEVTKSQVGLGNVTNDAQLPLAGGTMTGAINMGSNKVTSLANGTASGDAVNKSQLDSIENQIKVINRYLGNGNRAIANTTTETVMFPSTGFGSTNISSSHISEGNRIEFNLAGIITTDGSEATTGRIRVSLTDSLSNETFIFDGGARTTGRGLSSNVFDIKGYIDFRDVFFNLNAFVTVVPSASIYTQMNTPTSSSTGTTIGKTSYELKVYWTWGDASVTNSIVIKNSQIKIYKLP